MSSSGAPRNLGEVGHPSYMTLLRRQRLHTRCQHCLMSTCVLPGSRVVKGFGHYWDGMVWRTRQIMVPIFMVSMDDFRKVSGSACASTLGPGIDSVAALMTMGSWIVVVPWRKGIIRSLAQATTRPGI